MPIFSIIIPVYNVEIYLKTCLDSISKQTFHDFEVIIVDDGSTDASAEIASVFTCADHRFKLFKQHNQGQAIAREFGLTQATGRYVCFIDSDDYIEYNYLSSIAPYTNNDKYDFINFGFDFIDESKKTIAEKCNFNVSELKNLSIFHDALIEKNVYTVVWNKAIRKDFLILNKISFPDMSPIEDVFYSKILAYHATNVCFINKKLYHALSRQSSSSRRLSVDSFVQADKLLNMEFEYFKACFSNATSKEMLMAHVLKFYSYLLVQACYRVKTDYEFNKIATFVHSSDIYNLSLKLSSVIKLPIKNIMIVCLASTKHSLYIVRILSKLLAMFNVKPY